MRCRRDARGNISTLVHVHNRPRRLRPGLAVTLRGPRRVQPGTTTRYVARVQNRRRGGDRLLSSLWGVTLTGGTRSTRMDELRAGRSRRVVFTVRVPRAARGRLCTRAVAGALGARGRWAGSAHDSRQPAARPGSRAEQPSRLLAPVRPGRRAATRARLLVDPGGS
jgi:hypothetical protein